ncbi:MAG: MBOAT family protein [Lachnospiraceae bacterium]|nr:MBOAT family protein [Lachnospiraceae bacterium]
MLVTSYYFYMSWNPKYVVIILGTTVISYIAGLLVEKYDSKKIKKLILLSTLFICLGVLFIFKYSIFTLNSLIGAASLFGLSMQPLTYRVMLPVGISFYTFQTISYVIDVYNKKIPAEKHFGIYATFVSFFPQLVAGPIERSTNLLPQITSKKVFNYDKAIYGFRQILWGFFKKIAVADVLATYVNRAYEKIDNCTGLDLSAAILLFTIQIYCDFSGYSDIAIGSAKLLGIDLTTNFLSPYFSTSVKEFWSRWHISLSTWFKDYVYIPLGGNRCTKLRNSFNLLVTFIVSGLWHGANWTYIFWGTLHGGVQVFERITLGKRKKNTKNRFTKIVCWISVFIFINLAWVFFRASTISDAFLLLKRFFISFSNLHSFTGTNIGLGKKKRIYILIVISIISAFDYYSLKKDFIEKMKSMPTVVCFLIEYIILAFVLYTLYTGVNANPFVYFQF